MRINQFDPSLSQEDLNQLRETIDSNWLTEGPKTAMLEGPLQKSTGSRHVIWLPTGPL